MTAKQKNYNRRVIDCRGPHFRIDSGHPQVGQCGAEVVKLYATNDNEDVFLLSHSQGGLSRISADKTLEVRVGDRNTPGKNDLRITAANGNITVNADNGSINVKAKNVMVKADQDLDLNAGRNVNITGGSGRIMLKANTVAASGKRGNLIHKTFGLKMFASSYVPNNILQAAFGADASINTLTKGASAFSSMASGGFGGFIADSVLSETGLGGALGGQLSGELGGLFSQATDSIGGLEGKLGGLTDKLGGLADKLPSNLDGLGLSKGQLSNITNKLGNFDTSKFSGVLEGGLGDISSSLTSGLGGIEGKLGDVVSKIDTDKITNKLGDLTDKLGG